MGWITKSFHLAVRVCEAQLGWWQKYRIFMFIFRFLKHLVTAEYYVVLCNCISKTCVVHRKRQWATIRSWRQSWKRNIGKRRKRLIKSRWEWRLWPSRMRRWLPCEYAVKIWVHHICLSGWASNLLWFFCTWLFPFRILKDFNACKCQGFRCRREPKSSQFSSKLQTYNWSVSYAPDPQNVYWWGFSVSTFHRKSGAVHFPCWIAPSKQTEWQKRSFWLRSVCRFDSLTAALH